jgi:hypothetical protein
VSGSSHPRSKEQKEKAPAALFQLGVREEKKERKIILVLFAFFSCSNCAVNAFLLHGLPFRSACFFLLCDPFLLSLSLSAIWRHLLTTWNRVDWDLGKDKVRMEINVSSILRQSSPSHNFLSWLLLLISDAPNILIQMPFIHNSE